MHPTNASNSNSIKSKLTAEDSVELKSIVELLWSNGVQSSDAFSKVFLGGW